MMRVGTGYDVHRLVPERKLILGGVEIPFVKGLLGHSDADVLIHAIMDALLGGAGMGDIGGLFPDDDASYRGISSLLLLERVRDKLQSQGFTIINIDCTIIAQAPKLSAYIPEMKIRLANSVHIGSQYVNVKATTTEGLGFTGTGEGIAAQAVCLVMDTSIVPFKNNGGIHDSSFFHCC